MFEKLKRAKSFLGRAKPPPVDLDLSEASHLRRTTPISPEVLSEVRDKTLRQNSTQNRKQCTTKHIDDKKCSRVSNKDLEDCSSKSNTLSEEQQMKYEFITLNSQEKHHNTDLKLVCKFASFKQEISGKKLSRSKSARESLSQFMKRYPHKIHVEDEI